MWICGCYSLALRYRNFIHYLCAPIRQLPGSNVKVDPAFDLFHLIGLVLMLAGFGGEGGADNLGGGMAAALITTLYGAVFANLFFLPMAQKMGNKTTQTSMSSNLLVEAARLIHMKKHPLIVREKLNSFIPPAEWKRE